MNQEVHAEKKYNYTFERTDTIPSWMTNITTDYQRHLQNITGRIILDFYLMKTTSFNQLN